MIITLVFLAALLAFFLGWILSRSYAVKPWLADGGSLEPSDPLPQIMTTPRVGLGVFMAVASALFALAISAYHMRMEFGEDWLSVPSPALLWVNSAVLVLASLTLQWSWNAARRDDGLGMRRWHVAGGFFSVAFMFGQVLVWRDLQAGGYFMTTNPANAFFYLLTGLHVAHLLGGLVVWVHTSLKFRGGALPGDVRETIELCAIYWHYLLVIWLILFALLLTT